MPPSRIASSALAAGSLLLPHRLLSAGASTSHLPLVCPAGWLLRHLSSRRLRLAPSCCLPSTQRMALFSVSHQSRCLLLSLSPIVSRHLTLPPPPDVSLYLLLLSPPLISQRLSSLAGRLIVTSLRHLLLLLSSCRPPLCRPLHQGSKRGGSCPCI